MPPGFLSSPVSWLARRVPEAVVPGATDYERWWWERGQAVSDAVDRAGTPHLRMFDALGQRIDQVLYPPEYRSALEEGYRAGVVWRAFDRERSLLPAFGLGYVTSFFDAGLYCPYTVSLSTAIPLEKYGSEDLRRRFLEPMLRRDGMPWQGATWMTEVGGGSDLGTGVLTRASRAPDDTWRLDGEKYFCSNVGADLAVVAARPEGAEGGVRGLRLFVLPHVRRDGSLNYLVRRLKDKIATRSVPTGEVELRASEAYLLEGDVHLILEVLNVSRVANSVGSVALAQRALADVQGFAAQRVAFGRPIIEHPLLAAQFRERVEQLEQASALAWEAACQLDAVRDERPPYSPRYHAFRLIAHLAKYWTAELAAQTAKWAIEVFGGVGTLQENRVERWLREAMILAIWEGTPHRQMLDGLEVIERRAAHRALFERLRPHAPAGGVEAWEQRMAAFLARDGASREEALEPLFRDLARFAGEVLARERAAAPA